MISATTLRTRANICMVIYGLSFILPTLKDMSGRPSTLGYEACLVSFYMCAHISSFDFFEIPIALAWLANISAIISSIAILKVKPLAPGLIPVLVSVALTALGPLLLVAGDLTVGYYAWATSVLGLALLASIQSMNAKIPRA